MFIFNKSRDIMVASNFRKQPFNNTIEKAVRVAKSCMFLLCFLFVVCLIFKDLGEDGEIKRSKRRKMEKASLVG